MAITRKDADERPSRMTVLGIERRADGMIVVHAPYRQGEPPRTYEAATPSELWMVVRDLLNDPSLPQITTQQAGDTSFEEVVGQIGADLFNRFITNEAPQLANLAGRAARSAAKATKEKATNMFDGLRKADLPMKYYPRGT